MKMRCWMIGYRVTRVALDGVAFSQGRLKAACSVPRCAHKNLSRSGEDGRLFVPAFQASASPGPEPAEQAWRRARSSIKRCSAPEGLW